jgi:hypothetical protein
VPGSGIKDYLPALKRLEADLKKKLAGRARNPKRWVLALVLFPLLAIGSYDGAAYWLLSGPKLRALINTNAESLTIDYDEAASFWPGRLTLKNLRIRGSDKNVQWIILLADARVDYSVLALARRTFRAERLRGAGLTFFLRNKIDPAELKTADASVLPPVAGFADPPLRAEQPEAAGAPGNPWRVDVRAIGIDHFDDIWVDAFHYQGVARLEGGFFLRPGLLAHIGPAAVRFASGQMHVGHATAGLAVSGTVSGEFAPFEPIRMHGSEVWETVSGDVKLDFAFERLESLGHIVRAAATTRLGDGDGKGTIRGAIEKGNATGEIRAKVQNGSVSLDKLKLSGDAELIVRIPRWDLKSGPLEVSGSKLSLTEVRASGSDDSRRWWGRFDVPSGTIGATTSAKIEATTRDARPLLAVLAAGLPAWTRGLVNLDDLKATANVEVGPAFTRVRGLDARGGNFRIRGHYLREKAKRDGAFLIESDALNVGLELERDATKIRLIGAKTWFEAQPDGSPERPNAAPPTDAAP